MENQNLRKVIYDYFNEKREKIVNEKGYFHCWGSELYETSESTYAFTVGIIEDANGNIHSVNPESIKFENWV